MAQGNKPIIGIIEGYKIRKAGAKTPKVAVLTVVTSRVQDALELELSGYIALDKCQLSIEDLARLPELQGKLGAQPDNGSEE